MHLSSYWICYFLGVQGWIGKIFAVPFVPFNLRRIAGNMNRREQNRGISIIVWRMQSISISYVCPNGVSNWLSPICRPTGRFLWVHPSYFGSPAGTLFLFLCFHNIQPVFPHFSWPDAEILSNSPQNFAYRRNEVTSRCPS